MNYSTLKKDISSKYFYLIIISSSLMILFLILLNRKEKIIRYANKWVGNVEEISGNMGFTDKEFESLMHEYGDFRKGDPWCMSFVKMIWTKKTKGKYQELLDRLMTPSTQGTFANFEKDKSNKFYVSKKPKRGSIVIWQKFVNGSPTYQGHAGIVTRVGLNSFSTIEGNTDDTGTREGYTVSKKKRDYNWNVNNGLRLKGFINLKNFKF